MSDFDATSSPTTFAQMRAEVDYWRSEATRLTAERDRLAAALAEVKAEALVCGVPRVTRLAAAAVDDLATAYRRRVAGEVLREAAREYAVPSTQGGGAWATVRSWLEGRATEYEEGRR